MFVVFTGFILTIGIVLFQNILAAKNKKQQKEAAIASLPDFTFHDLNNNMFSSRMLLKQPTVIIYFDSSCSHCQYEAIDFLKHIKAFQQTNTLWVSEESVEAITAFISMYDFQKHKQIKFLKSTNNEFSTAFRATTTPTILVYDQEKQLLKKCMGISDVLTVLKNIGIG